MALNTSQPFTRREALAAGIPVDQLAGPRYQRLFHGLYLSSSIRVTVAERARAALKISPEGSFASHHTAASLWGGTVPDTPETHVSVPAGLLRSKRQGIRAHRAPPVPRTVTYRGLLLSTPMHTFLEMAAARCTLVDLVVLGDSLVKAKRFTSEELRDTVDLWIGAGAALARRAARLVREGVDSPTESRLRMLIVLAGLPEPAVNVIIRLANGNWQRRFDLSYPDLKLIIEYDGRQHADDARQWNNDILRREELEAQGWRMIIINADALFNHPSNTLLRIREALASRGCSNLPRRVHPVWRRHFVDRNVAA